MSAAPSVAPPPRRFAVGTLWRPVKLVLKALVAVALVAGAVAGARLVREYVRSAPAFAVTELDVVGNERISGAELEMTAGLRLGQNVFTVPPEEVQRRIHAHPWIATAQVRRRLPGSLHIEVREHHAAAVLAVGDELYLVGDDGTVFKSVEPGDPVDLPMISGVDRTRFVRDRPYRTSILIEAVALMHDYRSAGLWRREPISEVSVAGDDAITLFVGEDSMEVRLGQAPFARKLRKLRRVLDRLRRREVRAMYIYLDNVRRPDRVTLKLRELPEVSFEGEAQPSTGQPATGQASTGQG